MKRLLLLYFLVAIWATPVTVFADGESPWEKKLPFKSSIIYYAITGMEEGQETLYIRDSGQQRAIYHETVLNIMGMTVNNSTIELITPDYIYSYDLQNSEGSKATNPQKYMIEEYEKLSVADKKKVRDNAEKTGTAYMEGMGAEGMGGEIQQNAAEILGYSCDKVEIMGGASTYLIHGTDIPLKTEMDMMGMKMNIEATSIEKGDVDDRFFQHPAGINAEVDAEADAVAREMARRVIAMLKDPENITQKEAQLIGIPKQTDGLSEEDKQMMQQLEQMMQGMKGIQGQ
ncbi:MAG: hypothetical protein GY799_32515 [Desulfobulbaceae bacterium]|nr:hypothetical protein [Desulfobulbaceae bacterium]